MNWNLGLRRGVVALSAVLALGAALASCGSGGGASAGTGEAGKLRVATAFYPLQEAAQQIGGDRVVVSDLTPVGGEPHELDPAPEAIADLERAKVVLYLGDGFQPAVEKAVSSLPSSVAKVDLLAGVALRSAARGIPGVQGDVDGGAGEALSGGKDPHVWVDPARFIAMAKKVQVQLVKADPAHRSTYEANGAKYLAKLSALNDRFKTGLRDCQTKVIVTSHAAFGYLADRYGLTQAAIAGISPEEEPDPKSLAATADYAKANGVKTVFFESLVPKKLSETVANEIGATTDALNPVEGLTADELAGGETYASIMDDNLRRLEKGLGCTKG